MVKRKEIPTIEIDSWNEFEKRVSRHQHRQWIYRGQADSKWLLESSYHRFCDYVKSIRRRSPTKNDHEKVLLSRFKHYAQLYLDRIPSKDAEWLALMQHHGTPTRLLDWSFSPYIAAYFAVETGQSNFSIYCMNHEAFALMDAEYFNGEDFKKIKVDFLNYRDRSKSFIFAYEPAFKHKRLVAQQALFTVPSTNYVSYNEILKDYDLSSTFLKIVIPAKLRCEWIKKLSRMNINAATLFPDLDGFCRSIKFDLLYPATKLKDIN
ncbi:MAG: FRG domain-containing protein [Pseudomonadota bacterium]